MQEWWLFVDSTPLPLQIMIAEPGSRRKGIAKEALQLMLNHGHSQLVCPFIMQQPGITTQRTL